jgi:hypothetical protein
MGRTILQIGILCVLHVLAYVGPMHACSRPYPMGHGDSVSISNPDLYKYSSCLLIIHIDRK